MTTAIACSEADLPLGLLCILRPAAVRVLQAMGLDLTLEHERPFEEACAMRDFRVEVVLARIARAERVASTEPQIDWDVLRAHSVFAPPSAIAAG